MFLKIGKKDFKKTVNPVRDSTDNEKTQREQISNGVKITLEFLKQGKVVICPTDTVYGLICDATNKKAVEKLFKIKKRLKTKPTPIFIKNVKMAKELAFINKAQEKFLTPHQNPEGEQVPYGAGKFGTGQEKVWPGKVTVVLKRKKGIRIYGVDKNTIALRIPDYKLINQLLKKINKPLTGTSANISGKPASTKIKEILKQFQEKKSQADLIIDAGNLPERKPSIVIDLTGKKPKILRK